MLIWATVLLSCIGHGSSYGNGAPQSRCITMTPGHGSQQNSVSPYSINTQAINYQPSSSVTVTVTGQNGKPLQGILLQARKANSNAPVGIFIQASTGFKMTQCAVPNDAITHADATNKTTAQFTWFASPNEDSDIFFIATVLEGKNIWWKNVKSKVLKSETAVDLESSDPDTATPQPTSPSTTTSGTNDSSDNDNDNSSNDAPVGKVFFGSSTILLISLCCFIIGKVL